MASRWVGRQVAFRWMYAGTWRVVDTDKQWALLKPLDAPAQIIASLNLSKVVWVCKHDLMEVITEQETLL